MSRLFISHSTNDKAEVEQLIDFLVLGMGVARSDIFCTSQNGTFSAGEHFMEKNQREAEGLSKGDLLYYSVLSEKYIMRCRNGSGMVHDGQNYSPDSAAAALLRFE